MAPLSSLLPLVALGLATLGLAAPSADLSRAPEFGTPEFLCEGARHYDIQLKGCYGKKKRGEAGTAEVFKRNKGFHAYICEEAEKHHLLLGGCENIETPDEWVGERYPSIDFMKKRAAEDELGRSKMCSIAEELGIEVDACNDD